MVYKSEYDGGGGLNPKTPPYARACFTLETIITPDSNYYEAYLNLLGLMCDFYDLMI